MTKTLLKKIILVVLLFSALGATILSILVYINPVLTVDISVSHYVQSEGDTPLRKALLLFFLRGISYFGIPTVSVWMVIIVAFIFGWLKYYREAIYFLATLLAPAIVAIIKLIIHRPRPIDQYVTIFDNQVTSSSFPSGHVTFYTAFFGYLFVTMLITTRIPLLIRQAVIIISILLIILISISRVYLGAHWLTDALGGYFFGFVFLSVHLYFYLKKIVKKVTPVD